MSKKITVKARPRQHTAVDRNIPLDTRWKLYYEKIRKLETEKEELTTLTKGAISRGQTLYNVTWVKPGLTADKYAMMQYYQDEGWPIPRTTEIDFKSMTQYLTDEQVEPELWKKERQGYPKKPTEKKQK